MNQTLNILILGKDPTLFASTPGTTQDTRKRHIAYAEVLRRKYPNSEVRIITYTPASQPIQTEQVSEGLRIYGTGSIHRATYLFGILKRLPKVLAKGWRPDVVTVQTPWEEGSFGYIIARLLKAKYLPQLHCDPFTEAWKKEHWLNPWRRIVAFWLLKHADRIRTDSNELREKVIKQLGISAEKVQTAALAVVNFHPVSGLKSDFKKKIAPVLETKKIVLFVGLFYAPKNLKLWVEAAEQISQQVSEVAFVMAGNGPLFNDIQLLVQQKKLTEQFYFLGSVGYEKLPEIYAAADVFLLSSNYESFGRVILEAYMAGVPVVSTAGVGPKDQIEHGTTGFLVPVGDSRAISDGVVNLLQDDDLRRRFGKMGQEKMMTQFSKEAMSEKVVATWENA